ncbi:MAG: conjugal transfer protein TraG N-terminal domain-containing protein [Steroidobacteraceae bacterium]
MFTIICIGRIDFLLAVLNGLAMITGQNSPSGFYSMVALGLLVGVLVGLFRGVIYQRLELQWTLVGWLLFEAMFVPKVTVAVEDVYTGATTTVANVPLGPAAIGSLTSTVGITLANAFGAAFSYPSMTSTGYMDSLELVNAIRDMDYGGANDGAANAVVPGVDYQRSLRSYLMDCVLYSISMELPTSLTWAKLRESADLLQDINVTSGTWFTTLYLDGSPAGQTLTCTDAYTSLAGFTQSKFLPAWEAYIGSKLGLTDTVGQMQGALDSLFGAGRSAQAYMVNAVLKKELELAEVGYQAQGNNEAGVVMRVQAMEQRRTQWASEQSLWGEMARPAIAFIEGFFYACSPFAAFMFCLGGAGIALFGRYVLLALWIQLWMPVLAVCNLYISIAAANDLQRLATAGTDPLSMVGLDSVWTETASWLAFGGLMVAATPLLSLILITGSYFALTSLTNRLSGGDHVDQRMQSPDVLSSAAVASVGPFGSRSALYGDDPVHGLHSYGAEQIAPSINLGRSITLTEQSRSQHVQDVSDRLIKEAFSGADLTRREGVEGFVSSYQGQSTRSSATESDRVLQGLAQSVVNDHARYSDLSSKDASALSGAVALGLLQGGSGPQVQQALQNIQGATDGERKAWAERIDHLARREEGHGVELARAIVQDEQKGSRSQFLRALGTQSGERWSEAVGSTITAQTSYDEVASLAGNADLRQSISSLAYGEVAELTGTTQELMNMVSKNGLDMSKVQDIAGTFLRRHWSPSVKHAFGAAAAIVLDQGSVKSAMDLARYSSEHFGGAQTTLHEVDPLVSGAGGMPNPTEEIRHHLPIEQRDPAAVSRRIDAEVSSAGQAGSAELRSRGEAAVHQFFEAERDQNKIEAERALAELDRIGAIEQGNAADSTWQDTRSLLRWMNEQSLTDQMKATVLENVGQSIGAAAARVHSTYEEMLGKTHNRALATASSLAAGAAGLVEGWQNVPQMKYDEGFSYAKSQGLPDVAARYYATQRKIIYESVGSQIDAELGHNTDFNEQQAEAGRALGDRGVEALDRAALGTDVARDRYLHDALALYRRNQAREKK